MRKILIFGANSLLSEHLIQKHSDDDISVVYYSKKTKLTDKNYHISEFQNLSDIYDVVYIVSASLTNDIDFLKDLIDVNIFLVEKITRHFKSSKIIYFSTVAVYDGIKAGIITSETLPSPLSLYGMSKLFAERIVSENANYAILRVSSMYGVFMKENTFLPKIVISAVEKNTISLLGNGERMQNYIHVEDVAALAKKLSFDDKNKMVMAVSPMNYSNIQIAKTIQELTGCKIYCEGVDLSRSIEYFENADIIKDHTFISMKKGLKELIEWKTK